MELDENSDLESDEGGAEVSFVSHVTTLIAQYPTRTSETKRCLRCRYFEEARKSGVLVEIDVTPRTGQKYAKWQKCSAYAYESGNPKTNQKVSPPTIWPYTSNEILHQLPVQMHI